MTGVKTRKALSVLRAVGCEISPRKEVVTVTVQAWNLVMEIAFLPRFHCSFCLHMRKIISTPNRELICDCDL